jgi:hypothetical protein
LEVLEKDGRSMSAVNSDWSVGRQNAEEMKRPTDRASAILWLLVHQSGPLPFYGVLVANLAAVPRLDAETKASRETQPRNRVRQIVKVAGGAIPIFVALGRKRKNRSRTISWVQIVRLNQLAGGRWSDSDWLSVRKWSKKNGTAASNPIQRSEVLKK